MADLKEGARLMGRTGLTTAGDIIRMPFDLTVGTAVSSAKKWGENAEGVGRDIGRAQPHRPQPREPLGAQRLRPGIVAAAIGRAAFGGGLQRPVRRAER